MLRLVSTGGDAPPAALVGPWAAGGRRFINGYGPTETTVAVVVAECREELGSRLPIGLPIANHRAYIIDSAGDLLPDGVPGELAVSGPGLARGYLHRPAATAERFQPDPFAGRVGERMYRTGDLVRWRHDGQLEFLGRLDRQLKIRGNRVEPAEIESALLEAPGVRQAAVEYLAHQGQLVGWVVGGESDDAELREFLSLRLPPYMIPGKLNRLPGLPMTAAGKVDRCALRVSLGSEEEFDMADGTHPVNDPEFVVVRNDEDQYSIWAADRPLPAGWTAVGEPADRAACLEYIDKAWTDLRPRSVRALDGAR
ncbi:AMP-binding protein [Actinoplanes sp. NPDC051346]|uniref:AMP-binding protein n=1 Tax=Actinoplanes sp. NPDC051346 TaxID=3155048 RepID=UPI003438143D